MSCPTCGLRLWKYDEYTLTCKNGHHTNLDGETLGGRRSWKPAVLVSATAVATLALDLLIRTIT